MDLKNLTNNSTESPPSCDHIEPPVSDHENDYEANTSQLNSVIYSDKLQSEVTEDERDQTMDRSMLMAPSSPYLGAENGEARNGDDDGDVTQSDLELENGDQSKPVPATATVSHSSNKDSAINFDFDDVSDAQTCQWDSCTASLKNLRDLMLHIEDEHIKPTFTQKPAKCLWNPCSRTKIFHSKSDLIHHIRSHISYNPLICPLASCTTIPLTNEDLLQHIALSHPQLEEIEFKQTFMKWEKYLDDFHTKKPITSYLPLKRDFSRYAGLENHQQFLEILPKPKIDFQKLQNVGVEDLVTEQVRKKGRTATAEINAGIREPFLWEDRQYKKFVASQSKYLFENEDVERIIDSENPDQIHNVDELKELEAKLKRKVAWSMEVNAILEKDLEKLKKEEERMWFMKESLLQVNLELEIPNDTDLYTLK
ncbi:hypothetical protein WICPIJ_006475 [Wickerhamomyces pijperi]|uniref:C2H2-type domain-containing protein n=1 Tax=Wickerhamomyces pijperi TaxID=599730 RepID=A0A9P8TK69_WICPI|nr:hypothetical protein WICPIJ_006475 [Wickerhamomyces pijperi]